MPINWKLTTFGNRTISPRVVRLLALRPRLAAGVLLSSDARPSVVPSVRATYMPPRAPTVTPLAWLNLTF